ncbi:hypothetical protein NSTC745_04331 [Nostoc sp. DSM 114161]|jgi:hypothetical protein
MGRLGNLDICQIPAYFLIPLALARGKIDILILANGQEKLSCNDVIALLEQLNSVNVKAS